MKIAVVGLWHLGLVTAACMSSIGCDVVAYDDNKTDILGLQQNKLPIFEPGLEELLSQGMKAGHLTFTHKQIDIQEADIIWITYDTPVNSDDVADVQFVLKRITDLFPFIKNNSIVLISSQLPLGSTNSLQAIYHKQYPNNKVTFAYSPENLRLGNAINVFMQPDRIVIGIDDDSAKNKLNQLVSKITQNIVWMSIKSAEMTKHAINAFLATSVVFANEIATLCEQVGANVNEVEQGLKSEVRIGPRAYLRAGNAFAGGTLARDVLYLLEMGQKHSQNLQLLSSVISSNTRHRQWANRKLSELFNHDLRGKLIAVMGLAYKPGTDTLRRSTTIETCQWLKDQGADISAYDPAIKELPIDLKFIKIYPTAKEAMKGANVAIIATECSEFMTLQAEDFVSSMTYPLVIDAGGFLQKKLQNDDRLNYVSVGKNI
jgi:UDPglucose 6-dehydrogenase